MVMFRCTLGLTNTVVVIVAIIFGSYSVTGHEESIDWSEIVAPPHLTEHYMRERHKDKDKDSLCPIIRPGENIAQPWRDEVITSDASPSTENKLQLPTHVIGAKPDCNDNSPNIVIKILFNRDDPCGKISDSSMLQIDIRDDTDDTLYPLLFPQ